MTLAVMLATDEDAFRCDMAETYHILDYKALPVETLAVLAFGLRENSRIKMKIAGVQTIPIEIVLPQIYDVLACIGAGLSGAKEAPPSMMDIVKGRNKEKSENMVAFDSGEDFRREWDRLSRLAGEGNG